MNIRNKFAVAAVAAVALSSVAIPTSANAATTSSASGCVTKTLRQGSTGTCVRYVQQILGNLTVDGIYGSATRANVLRYQNSLSGMAVDGIVGPVTWRYICTPLDGPSWSSVQKAAGCRSIW